MPIRIGGLSSGTDYAGMVEQMMEARRVPIDMKTEEQVELDYDLGAWSEVNSQAEALTEVLDKLRGFNLWRSMNAESSLESVVTATAATASAEQQYTISVSSVARAQSISSDLLDTTSDLITNGYVAEGDIFNIEGEQITIEAGETLSSLRTKINSAALNMAEGSRVQASIVNNHLVLTREDTGAGSISLSDVTGTALQGLGVLDGGAAIKNENVTGADAQFTVNGLAVTRSSNTELTDVIDGLTINLEGVGTTTLDIHPDRETIKETLLEFVEKYNTLSEQVSEYSKIELGGSSELSMKGELYGDTLINSIRSSLRQFATMQSSALDATNASYTYKGQTGIMDNLADIGIWTAGQENKLEVLDESKLDDMLKYEFENMEQLFKGVYDPIEVAYTDGVASDFYNYISRVSESLTGDIAQRIDTLTNKYDDLADEIDEMNDALDDYEQDLWDQFTFMEDSLANMKSQTDYLKQVFSSGK
jgi:flagellar hook-associated protein 2